MIEYIEYVLNNNISDVNLDNTTDRDINLMNGEYYRIIVFEDNTVLRIKIKEK